MDSKPKSRVRAAHAAALLLFIAALLALAVPANAAFPGQNGKIVFVSHRDGNPEIYVTNADGTGVTRLTNNPAWDAQPSLSPDGRTLAFIRLEFPFFHVYIAKADGSGERRLTQNSANEFSPVWSPDGTRIAFEYGTVTGASLHVANLDGSGEIALTTTSFANTPLSWSPDGNKILFRSDRIARSCSDAALYVMNADGTGQTLLSSAYDDFAGADWSPDGRQIAFSAGFNNDCEGDYSYQIHRMNADATGDVAVPAFGQEEVHPVWSPDGQKIAFSSDRSGEFEMFTMNADGSQQAQVPSSTPGDGAWSWQSIPGPQRSDFKNAAKFCKADRAFLGESAFAQKYGANGNGANAFGKCVSADGH